MHKTEFEKWQKYTGLIYKEVNVKSSLHRERNIKRVLIWTDDRISYSKGIARFDLTCLNFFISKRCVQNSINVQKIWKRRYKWDLFKIKAKGQTGERGTIGSMSWLQNLHRNSSGRDLVVLTFLHAYSRSSCFCSNTDNRNEMTHSEMIRTYSKCCTLKIAVGVFFSSRSVNT